MSTEKHYVDFYSPGTFFDERSSQPIGAFGDVGAAIEMAKSVEERYSAKPYGFRFGTYLEADPIPDERGGTLQVEPKRIAQSGTYFINGRLRKYDEVVADNDPKESILRSNMRCNQMCIVVETRNSWKHTTSFDENDFVVNDAGGIVQRGNDPELVAYRKEVCERIAKEQ